MVKTIITYILVGVMCTFILRAELNYLDHKENPLTRTQLIAGVAFAPITGFGVVYFGLMSLGIFLFENDKCIYNCQNETTTK